MQPALTTGMPRMIDVTMWSQQFDAFDHFVKENPNNSRHPFFQPNYKSIMVMSMSVKEVDIFFCNQLAIFRPDFVKNCEFSFFV